MGDLEPHEIYKGNSLLPKAGLKRSLTQFEYEEFKKCMDDPIYFANNYFYAVHQEHGLTQIKFFDYQNEALEKYIKNGRLCMLTSRQAGKALALSTKVPLFDGGFTTIGDLKIGDRIIGSNGKDTKVTFKSEIHNKTTYRITFDDKTSIDACEDHLWTVTDRYWHNKETTKSTKELLKDYKRINSYGYNVYRYFIQNISPVQYNSREIELDPYILGAWLGDGSTSGGVFTCHIDHKPYYESKGIKFTQPTSVDKNPNVFTRIIEGLHVKLKKYNLIGKKHIPEDFLYNSFDVRKRVLEGIIDTDGYINKQGRLIIEFSDKHDQLIKDTLQLLHSFGLKVFVSHCFNKQYNTSSTRMSTSIDRDWLNLDIIPHKSERLTQTNSRRDYSFSRTIQNIEIIENIPTQCITVDSDDHLFAVGEFYTLTHNTTTATAIILHAALFNKNKNIALLANLQATAIEILDRIKEAFENLPLFLRSGVKTWNRKTVKFENGTTIFANASKGSSVRGKSIFLLYVDECAFVDNWEEFAASTLPTISSNKDSRIIYTSTPNGLNHFHEYCTLAKANKNGFEYVEVPWYKVPGRDEAWRQKTLQDINYDEQRFAAEYECEFMGSSGTLISGATLKLLEHQNPIYTHEDLRVYEDKTGNDQYAIIVDSSQGKGLDFSAFSVIKVTSTPYKQVATFRSNRITPQDYAQIINTIAKRYNYPSILIELNCPAGAIVSEILFWDYEYENILMTESAGRAGKKISSGFGGKDKDRGVFTSTAVKGTGCTMLKLLVEQKQLELTDKHTIDELKTFSKKGKSYEAEEGKHDDLTMGLVLFGWLTTQEYFRALTDVDVNKSLVEKTDQEIEDYVNGLGVMVVNSADYESLY